MPGIRGRGPGGRARGVRHCWQRSLLLLGVVVLLSASAGVSGDSGVRRDYSSAIHAWSEGRHEEACRQFQAIASLDTKDPATLKSLYFLARCAMERRAWDEAARLLVSIHELSPAFYSEWNCDYLLGECRTALGED